MDVLGGVVVLVKVLASFNGVLSRAFTGSLSKEVLERFDAADEAAAMFVVIAGCTMAGIRGHVLPRSPHVMQGVVLMLGLVSLLVVAGWHAMVALVVQHVCLFLLSNFLSVCALQAQQPLSRYRLLGTVVSQLLALAALSSPHWFEDGFVLAAVVILCCGLLVILLQRLRLEAAAERTRRVVADFGVSAGSAVLFVAVALLGLNGEQILDASFKLAFRQAHLEGDAMPLALHHSLTILSRLLAFSYAASPPVLALCWALVQAVRLVALDLPFSLWSTATLIFLDKLFGSWGEIALETVLLRRLNGFPRGLVSAGFLLGLLQPIEDVTGSFVKHFVRHGAKSENPAIIFFYAHQKIFISLMVAGITYIIVTWSSSDGSPDSESKKSKSKKQV